MGNTTQPRIPPKRGQVLWRIIKSFTKSENPNNNHNGGGPPLSSTSPTPAATPSGYASESSGPLDSLKESLIRSITKCWLFKISDDSVPGSL